MKTEDDVSAYQIYFLMFRLPVTIFWVIPDNKYVTRVAVVTLFFLFCNGGNVTNVLVHVQGLTVFLLNQGGTRRLSLDLQIVLQSPSLRAMLLLLCYSRSYIGIQGFLSISLL